MDDYGDTVYTVCYILFAVCLVIPPDEIIAAGFSLEYIFSTFVGSETMNFVSFHIKRIAVTYMVHSCIPFGYFFGLKLRQSLLFASYLNLFIIITAFLPIFAIFLIRFWSLNNWSRHPLARTLALQANNETDNYHAVASSVNIEFRRIDKFSTGVRYNRVYFTDSWILKVTMHHVDVIHQQNAFLHLHKTDEHSLTVENSGNVQYLNIRVSSLNNKIEPFEIRLLATDYNDMKEKLQAPLRTARDLIIRQTLSERFLEEFKVIVRDNPKHRLSANVEVETCIGCLREMSDVMLVKLCDAPDSGECKPCYCRPMWCLECMGKWFASRQDQQQPQTWLGSKAPCPTCRATFCVLDVCQVSR